MSYIVLYVYHINLKLTSMKLRFVKINIHCQATNEKEKEKK